jgi:hypothetical protein
MMYVKAFIAGIALPASVLPIAYSLLYLVGYGAVRRLPLQFFPLIIDNSTARR